jgi:cysteine desulfurase
MPCVYLDHAATTPLDGAVRRAMEPYMAAELDSVFGNPSSRHPAGVRAAEALDGARRTLARALGARPEGVVFTSGGTEANNLAVFGLARAAGTRRGGHVLVGPSEHPSTREPCQALVREGFEVETLRLTPDGELDLEHAAECLRPETVLVVQMLVQNELGSIYPVARLARLMKSRSPRARLHVDAVQAVGKLACAPADLGADTLTLSAHKLGGPKGAGALVIEGDVPLAPLFLGGGQERALRPGTQNVAAAVGLATAVERAQERRNAAREHGIALRERFVAGLRAIDGADLVLPEGAAVVPSIVAVRLRGAPAEVRMHHLEARGVLTSAGSACQAAKREVSPTYAALGLDLAASREVLRFSFAPTTTPDEIDAALAALAAVARDLEGLARGERSAR